VEFVGVDIGEFFEEQVEVAIVGIDAEEIDPMLRFGDEIFVGEHVNGDADGEKREAFDEFEGGDEEEAARMLARARRIGWRISLHFEAYFCDLGNLN